MKGTNTLQLSYDDLKQAMQDWCDAHLVDKPIVDRVEVGREGRGDYGALETKLTLKPRAEVKAGDFVDLTLLDRVR